MDDSQLSYLSQHGISEHDCSSCSKSLIGTVKPYDKHIIICSGGNGGWKARIEEEGVALQLTSALESYNRDAKRGIKIIITATEYDGHTSNENGNENENEKNEKKNENEKNEVQIISYPKGVTYSVPVASDFTLFLRHIIQEECSSSSDDAKNVPHHDENAKDDKKHSSGTIEESVGDIDISCDTKEGEEHSLSRSISVRNAPWRSIVLVCVHASRDNRCGRAGPQIIEEFNRELSERGIKDIVVAGSSHIGGHKYAGVLVVYPQGDWYGLISKRNVPALLDSIMDGTRYLKGWRGNESLNW